MNAPAQKIRETHQTPHRILVVDDEPHTLDLLSHFLRGEGFEPLAASSGAEALARIEADAPEVVLLDLVMPRISGFEVIERIRSRGAPDHLPILVLTSLTDTEFKVRALEIGADDHLAKPFAPDELFARIRTLLRIGGLQKELRRRAEDLARANRSLRCAQERLIKAEKLAAIVELAGAVNHELNQPLTVILGQAELLMSELPAAHPGRGRLEKIARSIEKATGILRRMNHIEDYRTRGYTENTRIIDLRPKLPAI